MIYCTYKLQCENKTFIFLFFRFSGSCDEHEYRLTKDLLEGYDAAVRPAKNSSRPLTVAFGLALHHIIDVVKAQD